MQAMADERRTASPAAHVSKAQQNVLFCHFPDVLFCQHVTFSIGGRVEKCMFKIVNRVVMGKDFNHELW